MKWLNLSIRTHPHQQGLIWPGIQRYCLIAWNLEGATSLLASTFSPYLFTLVVSRVVAFCGEEILSQSPKPCFSTLTISNNRLVPYFCSQRQLFPTCSQFMFNFNRRLQLLIKVHLNTNFDKFPSGLSQSELINFTTLNPSYLLHIMVFLKYLIRRALYAPILSFY